MSDQPCEAEAAQRGDGGFTLLEVLVAFAIAAPALAVLYQGGVGSMETTRAAASYQEAMSRAQSRLDALAGAALVAGEQDGDDGDGFRWRTRIAPVAMLAPLRIAAPRGSPYIAGTTLYTVLVEVSWRGSRGMRTFVLDTRRLGNASATRRGPAPPDGSSVVNASAREAPRRVGGSG